MEGEVVRRRLVIHGHVQGVFFRDSLRDCARTHGVAGWARNCSDGTLEAVLEGDAAAVAEVVSFCETGPREASVERMETFDDQAPEGLSGFDVR